MSAPSPRLAGAALTLALLCGAGCDRTSSAGGSGSLAVAADADFAAEPVADFRLPAAHGGEVSLADLRGQPFVLDFIFTTCSGPCPTLSANMAELQDELADTRVALVSISVDPKLDTLEALRAYAERHEADPERWHFLRAEPEDLQRLAASGMRGVQETPEGGPGAQVSHSTRFVVVDGAGVVRGYYPGDEEQGRRAAAARARWLARNPGR